MKKILLTGGAGFIGANLLRKLLNDGKEVTVLDNFHSGRRENLTGLKNVRLLETDVASGVPEGDYDGIFHLACPASPPFYQKDPIFTTRTCVLGTMNMLELATRCDCPLLIASTSEVYGDPAIHPQVETYWGNVNCTGIRSCYDEGKRCAESLAFDYRRTRGTKIKVVRIFNTYGPYMRPDDGRVVSNFIMQALNHEPLTVYGEGKQTRSLCFVEDLIAGFCRMIESPDTVSGPVNLGNPSEFTMIELANLILELTGSKSEIIHQMLPSDDPKQRRPDISRAQQTLGWSPRITPREGLARTIEYFRNFAKSPAGAFSDGTGKDRNA